MYSPEKIVERASAKQPLEAASGETTEGRERSHQWLGKIQQFSILVARIYTNVSRRDAGSAEYLALRFPTSNELRATSYELC